MSDSSNSNSSSQSSGPNPQAQTSQPQEGSAKPESQMTAAEKRMLKLKVDGAEESLPEEEVIKLAQMGRSASKRFQEAAKMKKQAEEFVSLLKTNPRKVLTDPNLGLNFRELAEQYLAEQLQQEMLSPEERRMREMESKLREYEDSKKAQEQVKQQEELMKLQEHYAQDYDRKITDALKTAGVPKSPKTVKRMAELMYTSLENGYELEPAQIATLVRQDYISEIQELFGQSDEDTLLALLGDGVANKLRKADLKRIKSPITQSQRGVSRSESESKSEKKYLSRDEWKEMLDKRTRS